MSAERTPTKAELRVIGLDLHAAIAPVIAQNPGMEVVVSYMLPRPGEPGQYAQSVVSSMTDPQQIVILLVHGAQEVQQQLVDPFYVSTKRSP